MRYLLPIVFGACLLGAANAQTPKVAEFTRQARAGKWRASFELAKLGKPGVAALIELLGDRTLGQRTRYMAANALGSSGSPDAYDPLIAALDDSVMNVRRCAASALGFLGDKRAIPALEKLAANDPYVFRDPNTGKSMRLVRNAALDALSRLRTGKPRSRPRARPNRPVVVTTDTAASAKIPWVTTIEAALEKAKAEDKPVLATVVPLDDKRWSSGFAGAREITRGLPPHPFGNARAAQIDSGLVKERMLMATVFSDPEVIAFVSKHFVPVRIRVHTYVFDPRTNPDTNDPLRLLGTNGVETGAPALVFARGDGTRLHACRRMGVFSVPFTLAMLRAVVRKLGVEPEPVPPKSQLLTTAWKHVSDGQWQKVIDTLDDAERTPEADYLYAYAHDKLGRPDVTRLWQALAARDAGGSWGSRARLRLARTGGRLDEWETVATFAFDPLAPSTERRFDRKQLGAVIGVAVDLLLRKQHPTGEWADPFVDVHPAAGPGSQYDRAVARTGLVVDCLMRAKARVEGRDATLERAIRRGIDFVGRFADAPEPWIWQLTYALHLQIAILGSDRSDAEKQLARTRARKLVAALAGCQHQGGWSYMPPPRIHTFNTAPVLLMLAELRDLGIDVPEKLGDNAAKFLLRQRQKADPREYAYASNINHKHLGASSCRTAVCELALLRHSRSKDTKRLRAGIELFFANEAKVRGTTKVFESYFSPYAMHDAYHHFFGHYYAARSLAHLDKQMARRFANRQIDTLLAQVELDGSFVDAQMQGKSYSTAMALLTLFADLDAAR